jgi:hypothetical protein
MDSSLVNFTSNGVTLTEDHIEEAIKPALAWAEKICDQFNIELLDTEVEAILESEIPGAFGSVDVIGGGTTHNLILDWKMGRGVAVEAENNQQLMFYAAGAMLNPALADLFNPALPTVLAICQPRIFEGNSYTTVDTCDLVNFIATLKGAVKASERDGARIDAGKHCRFCPAEAVCPKKLGIVESLPPAVIDDLPRLLAMAPEVEQWAKAVYHMANNHAEAGGEIKGYKLVQKRSTRIWSDVSVATKRFRGMKLKVADIFEHKLRSPAQLEKILKKKGKRLTVMGELVEKTSPGLTLVPDSDKRQEVPAIGHALENLAKRTV